MNLVTTPPHNDNAALCRRLLAVAARYAVRRGLATPDRDDCALEFCERMLRSRAVHLKRYMRGRLPETWLHRCADRFCRNYARRVRHIQSHEYAWPALTDDAGETDRQDAADTPAFAAALCRRELNARLVPLLARLTKRQIRYLLLHLVHEQTYAEIAANHAVSEDSVRMTVNRALKRLRVLLIASGFDENEAADYLREMSARNTGGGQSGAACRRMTSERKKLKLFSPHPFAFGVFRCL